MKRVSYILFAVAVFLIVTIVGLTVAGLDDAMPSVVIIFAITFICALLAYTVHVLIRLRNGSVKLRLWDAFKRASIMFLVAAIALLVASVMFPNSGTKLWIYAVSSALAAILTSLHATAYRKPT